MSKYVIDSSTLTSIADAVRTKGGTTEPIVVSDIPTAITNIPSGGGGGLTAEDLTFTEDCSYLFYGNNLKWLIEKYGTQIVFDKVNTLSFGFQKNQMEDLSMLTINFNNVDGLINGCFQDCNKLVKLPKIIGRVKNSMSALFSSCQSLRDEEVITFLNNIAYTSDWQISVSNFFYGCFSLRNIDEALEKIHNMCIGIKTPNSNPSVSSMLSNSCSLDEITKFPVFMVRALTSNIYSGVFNYVSRCKNIMFCKNEDGTPIVAEWKSQTIDLTNGVGYNFLYVGYIINYNSGITADKEVTDDASYQALKNDPDWFTCDIKYSRYNHDSAVRTINSLPDTSAYLATAGGTNTIKFRGDSGSKTDGGAINTLTEEEIAVAAAKGWTVTLV